MRFHQTIGITSAIILALLLIDSARALAQSDADALPIALRLSEGRPLEIVLEEPVTIKAVGQRVSGEFVLRSSQRAADRLRHAALGV